MYSILKTSITFIFLLVFQTINCQTILYDGDIKIGGFDSETDDCGSKYLNLKVSKEILPNTEFTLINSNFFSQTEGGTWSNNPEQLSGMKVKYIGPDTVQVGDLICIFFFCVLEDEDPPTDGDGDIGASFPRGFQNIEFRINNQNRTNAFATTNINGGLSNDLFGLVSNNHLSIIQGEFRNYYGTQDLDGRIIEKLILQHIDTNETSNIDIGDGFDGPINIPGSGDSFYGYVICESTTCGGPENGRIVNFDSWTLENTNGRDGQLDLEQLCEDLCGEVNCDEELIVTIDQEFICDYYSCFTTYGGYSLLLDIFVDNNPIFPNILFPSNICVNPNCAQGTSSCLPTDICAAPSFLADQLSQWLDQNSFRYSNCYINTNPDPNLCSYNQDRAFTLVVLQTDAKLQYNQTSNYDVEYNKFNPCDVLLSVDASCNIDSILWSTGESGVTEILVDPIEVTEVTVSIICTNGCSYDQTITVIQEEPQYRSGTSKNIQSGLSIFPNPAKNKVNIDYPTLGENAQLSIYSTNGGKVYSEIIYATTKSKSIDITNYQSGMYLLVLNDGKISRTKKFIINK